MTPTRSDVALILPHIRYEIEKAFITPRHNIKDVHLHEAVFLSVLIHARILLSFFESSERRQDDVLCSDFGFVARPVDLKPENRMRFNKDLMHLTYSRLKHTSESKPWPLQDLMLPLFIRSFEFINHIIQNPPPGAERSEIEQWIALDTFYKSI